MLQLLLPELSLQYPILIQKKISISPLMGIGWFSAAPYQVDIDKNKLLQEISIDSKGSIMLGFDIGWEFYREFYYNPLYRILMNRFSSLNIHYHYQPVKFENVYSYLNGSAHTLAISIKFGFGGAQRVK